MHPTDYLLDFDTNTTGGRKVERTFQLARRSMMHGVDRSKTKRKDIYRPESSRAERGNSDFFGATRSQRPRPQGRLEDALWEERDQGVSFDDPQFMDPTVTMDARELWEECLCLHGQEEACPHSRTGELPLADIVRPGKSRGEVLPMID